MSDEKKTTKERILEAAFDLFSTKGFDSTGVDEIAAAINLKGPSLYRHFKSKEAILEEIIKNGEVVYEKNFGSSKNLGNIPESIDELNVMSLQKIDFTMHNPMVIKFRKLYAMEQFKNQRLCDFAETHSITNLENIFTGIFIKMMEIGAIQKRDPKILAFEYMAPVSLLLQAVDRNPSYEKKAMEIIKKHFEYFAEVNKV